MVASPFADMSCSSSVTLLPIRPLAEFSHLTSPSKNLIHSACLSRFVMEVDTPGFSYTFCPLVDLNLYLDGLTLFAVDCCAFQTSPSCRFPLKEGHIIKAIEKGWWGGPGLVMLAAETLENEAPSSYVVMCFGCEADELISSSPFLKRNIFQQGIYHPFVLNVVFFM